MAVAVPSGKWVLQYGYKPLLIIGNGLLVVTAIMLYFLNETTSFWYSFAAMTVLGLAFGLIFTVSTIGSQQLVESHQKG
ncbi:MFS transporter, partial [Lysinibacillus sp. GbtcB16]|uniref:MFS transporter n=1 Tax=Lysinibacillus sp. GbtcB16 TaxID=2824761 RepID=UPI001C30B2A3